MSATTESAAAPAALHPARWLFWLVLSANMMFVHLFRAAPAVATDRLMATFAMNGAQLGTMASVFFYLYAAAQIPVGAVADWLGARRVATLGMFLAGSGALLFAAAPNLALLYAGRLLSGLGVSVMFVCILKVAADWFSPREFATLSGLSSSISHLGALLATLPLAWLIEALDWRTSMTVLGVAALLMAALTWLTVRDREDGGHKGPQHLLPMIGAVMKNPRSWPPLLIFLGVYTPYLAVTGMWGMPYLMQVHGMTRAQASLELLFVGLPVIAGTALIGYLSSRLGRRKLPMVAMAALGTAAWAALGAAGPVAPHWLLRLALAGAGCTVAGFVPAFAVAKEVNPPHLTGAAMGLTNVGGFLGASLFQPLIGWLLDRNWAGALLAGARVYPPAAYQGTIWLSAAVCALGLIAALVSTETYARNVSQQA